MLERLVELNIMVPAAIELFRGDPDIQEAREFATHLQDRANGLVRVIDKIDIEFPSLPDDGDILHGIKPEATDDEIDDACIAIERNVLLEFHGGITQRISEVVKRLNMYLAVEGFEQKERSHNPQG